MQLDRMKFLVALLHAKGASGREDEPVNGTTRLVKIIFLAQREARLGEFYDFKPYDYGPYASEIPDDVEALRSAGLVDRFEKRLLLSYEESDFYFFQRNSFEETVADHAPQMILHVYQLSPKGKVAARKLWEALDVETRRLITEIKRNYNSLPLTDLLRLVYEHYPEGAAASKIADKILTSRVGTRPHLSAVVRNE
jgi:uncharacterized protein YwgA